MPKYKLMILTETVLDYRNRIIYSHLRNYKWKFFPRKKGISGHYAVTRSLLDGLKKASVQYLFNEPLDYRLPETVLVLSNIDALKQAIKLKSDGSISKLYAGPNLVVLPYDHNKILCNKNIDFVVVNSDWTEKAYVEQAPELKGKTIKWPAGVDENYWKPSSVEKNGILVYWKSKNKQFIDNIVNIASKYGPVRIVKYGSYSEEEYKKALDKSEFSIFVSESESQGIALIEAWSMDVPTLVWQGGHLKGHGWKYSSVSSAPYLTTSTGKFWADSEQLEKQIQGCLKKKLKFGPRDWVLRNQTDLLSAKSLINMMDRP